MYDDPNENDYQGGTKGYLGASENTPFTPQTSDEDLIKTINEWVRESKTYHDLVLQFQNLCVRYYLGDQTDRADIPSFNSDSVYNRIFEGTETVVPIVTGGAHQFIAIPGNDDELSIKRASKLQKVLTQKYEDLEIQQKLENITRDIILKRFGVLKYFWNIFTDDVDVKTVDPRLMLIPRLRLDANDPQFPYTIELQEYTRDEIRDFFPNVDPADLVFGRVVDYMNPSMPSNIVYTQAPVYQVLEVWTNEMVVWKQNDKILKKMANPNWDWSGVEEKVAVTKQNGKVKYNKYRRYYNHLNYPQDPYIFINPFTTGDAPVADTSMAEVAIPIQDDINTQKRQIINNLVRMGNGQVYVDADALPKELEDQITSEPGLIISGKNLVSEGRIKREPGVQLPQAHFANLQESVVAFDNVFGTHGAVRGASGDTTLGGQILNRQQDLSRIDQLTRCLNRGVARLANGLVQLMKLYYDEEHVSKILGRDGALEFVRITQNDIDDGVVIVVKSGVPPLLDPVARYNQAIQLWQLGAIDPETLFERLEFADPQAASQKLQAWKQGQLLFDSQLRQQEAVVGAQAKAVNQGEGEGRGVETSNNVIDRAAAGLGGAGAAPLKNTPNGGQPLAIA